MNYSICNNRNPTHTRLSKEGPTHITESTPRPRDSNCIVSTWILFFFFLLHCPFTDFILRQSLSKWWSLDNLDLYLPSLEYSRKNSSFPIDIEKTILSGVSLAWFKSYAHWWHSVLPHLTLRKETKGKRRKGKIYPSEYRVPKNSEEW